MSEVGTTADINEIASYTEYNVTTPTADFAVGFDYDEQTSTQKGDAIRVTINRADPSTLGYTVTLTNKNTVNFSPSVPSGNTVRLQRETDIDSNLYTFSAGALFVATQVDDDFKQIRKSQQEVRDRTNSTLDYVETTIDNYNGRIETVELATAKNSQDIASEILRAKATEKGLQNQINNTGNSNTITPVLDTSELDSLKTWDGRVAYVRNDGEYYYSEAVGKWIKDSSFMLYDFKTEQPIQYYYDQLGNWDDAIFQAQLNIYLLGYSSKLILPAYEITITRPIKGGTCLGEEIYDYFQKNGIVNDFYNPITKQFKTVWNFNLQGAGQTQSYIKFVRPTALDKTYSDWGAIHVGISTATLQEYIETKDNSLFKNWWKTEVIANGFTLHGSVTTLGNGVPDKHNNYFPNAHGMVIAYLGSHHHNIQQIAIEGFFGGGLIIDHAFDSVLQDIGIYHCGKMVGDYGSWCVENGKTSSAYQLYAPLQLCKMSGPGDNSNHMRFYDFHMEDNYNVVVDAVFASSSPVRLQSFHFECESGGNSDLSSLNGKSAIWGSGGCGVKILGQENIAGFNIESFEKLGGESVIKSIDTVQYTLCYSHGYIGNTYSNHAMINCNFGAIKLMGNNDSAIASVVGGSIGGVSAGAISSQLAVKLDNVDVYGDISFQYNVKFSFKDVRCTGNFSIENTLPYNLPNSITGNSYFNKVSGHLYNCIGQFSTLSTTEPNALLITNGCVTINYDAYRMTKVGF